MTDVEHSEPLRKDSSARLTGVAALISSIAVPLVIAGIGAWYNVNIKDSQNRVRYVELAISLLRTPPTPENNALREWALEVLNSQAPVKLSPEAQRQLRSSPLSIRLSGAAVSQSDARGNLSTGRVGSAAE